MEFIVKYMGEPVRVHTISNTLFALSFADGRKMMIAYTLDAQQKGCWTIMPVSHKNPAEEIGVLIREHLIRQISL